MILRASSTIWGQSISTPFTRYDELEERHRFLENQNNDLSAARRGLLDVIARINATTRKLFAETFAQVRVNFREMFAELFGGGRAGFVPA